MPELKFYVSDDVEERIRARALEEGRAISDLVAEIVMSHFSAKDPQGNYFSRFFGSWTGNFPEVRRSPPIKRSEPDLEHVELYSDQDIKNWVKDDEFKNSSEKRRLRKKLAKLKG